MLRLPLRQAVGMHSLSSAVPRSALAQPAAHVLAGGGRVSVSLPSGEEAVYHSIWLRDHCRCPRCFHPVTKQRLVPSYRIPLDIAPRGVRAAPDGLVVDWPAVVAEHDDVGAQEEEGHSSTYPWSWLEHNGYSPRTVPFAGGRAGLPPLEKKLWGAEVAQAPPTVTWDDVMGQSPGQQVDKSELLQVHDADRAERGVLQWLENIAVYGFSFISGVPPTPEATEALSQRIAFIRPSHYALGLWDFTSNLAHGDTAYTDIALPAHTDTTYFTDPVGLQMFHLLSHNPPPGSSLKRSELGGASLLVDGFSVAAQLKRVDPDAYEALTSIPVVTHSAGDDGTLVQPLGSETGYPILQERLLPPQPGEAGVWRSSGELQMVRYNNDDRSVLRLANPNDVPRFYRALHKWNELLTSAQNEYWRQLEPGLALVFDNQRVLHARSSFVGERRLCGT